MGRTNGNLKTKEGMVEMKTLHLTTRYTMRFFEFDDITIIMCSSDERGQYEVRNQNFFISRSL